MADLRSKSQHYLRVSPAASRDQGRPLVIKNIFAELKTINVQT